MTEGPPTGLAALEGEAARALAYEGARPANWVTPREGVDHDVLIVGGGQSALALAFALRRAGIGRLGIVEAKAPGKAGIWDDIARMHRLRTAKTLTGPDLGFVPLSFPRWFEAQHGEGSFASITRIGRADWAEYLRWFEARTAPPVRHGTRLLRVEPEGEHLRVHLEDESGASRSEVARKLVLANGLLGLGTPSIPAVLSENLPRDLFRHTSEAIDFAALGGKVVGVIGTGASAFDAAAVALEAGAAQVHMFCRKPAIPTLQAGQPRGYPGAADHFSELPDALRWTLFNRTVQAGTPPPPDSVSRATRWANFAIHLGSEIAAARVEDGRIVATVSDGSLALDFIVTATGYAQNPVLSPELGAIAGEIALWRDRYSPEAAEANPALAAYPYLGPGFEFLEKRAGAAPFLRNLHCYTTAAALSFGRLIGDVPSMAWGISRLAAALSRDLFDQDFVAHRARITAASSSHEFDAGLYQAAVSRWRDDSPTSPLAEGV